MEADNRELQDILSSVPDREVIAAIERLNPPWKHDLLPWKVAKPDEEIPWQAVYVLIQQPASPTGLRWAEKRLVELGADTSVK